MQAGQETKAEFLEWVRKEAIKDAHEAALARKYERMAEEAIAGGAGSCKALLAEVDYALEVHYPDLRAELRRVAELDQVRQPPPKRAHSCCT